MNIITYTFYEKTFELYKVSIYIINIYFKYNICIHITFNNQQLSLNIEIIIIETYNFYINNHKIMIVVIIICIYFL